VAQHQRRQHGHVRQREEQRAQHSNAHRECHGLEHAALEALQREDRDVDGDDDADAEDNRPSDFERSGPEQRRPVRRCAAGGVLQPPDKVLDHDDGGVDQKSEVEGAETHEIRRHAESLHRDEREEQ
jgi:hypothetical protein